MTPTEHPPLWTLQFDRDGTEDYATICDADGDPIVTSRFFWRPERRDPIPETLRAVRLMAAAPLLAAALETLLRETVDEKLLHGLPLSDGQRSARRQALAALAQSRRHRPLPPDPDGRNDDRAEWAGRAVATFQKATGTEDEYTLCDLLSDLRHWADRRGYDFESALDRGTDHYYAETAGGDR